MNPLTMIDQPPKGRFSVASLIRCAKGSAILEFALVAPPFLALLIAILQIAIAFIAQAMLETTAESAARLILTGQAQTYSGTSTSSSGATTTYTGMTQSDYASAVCSALKAQSPFMSCSNLYIDVTTVSNYADATTSLPALTYDSSGKVSNSWSYAIGTQGSIVVLRVMYVLPLAGAPMGFSLGNLTTGKRLLLATSVFKVEGYT